MGSEVHFQETTEEYLKMINFSLISFQMTEKKTKTNKNE